MTIRQARTGDGSVITKLIPMALHDPHPSAELLAMGAHVDENGGRPDSIRYMAEPRGRRGAGRTVPINSLGSVRIADHQGRPVGLSYTVMPGNWIGRRSGLPLRMAAQLAERFTELNLLAVLPSHRGRGYGTALLEDVISRYRAAGYTALMVTTEDRADARLRPFYERHGFTFAPRGIPWRIRFWTRRDITSLYTDMNDDQYIGMLPLAPHVTTTPPQLLTGPWPTITGIMDERPAA